MKQKPYKNILSSEGNVFIVYLEIETQHIVFFSHRKCQAVYEPWSVLFVITGLCFII